MAQRFVAAIGGRAALAALAALRGGRARVFAAFERSCYVETSAGIACVGGPDIGLGPLNVIVAGPFRVPLRESAVAIDVRSCGVWLPACNAWKVQRFVPVPAVTDPWRHHREAQAFLAWLAADGPAPESANALIGLGPGLTPSGDDFVGGALIALRAAGNEALADRAAAWALALAEKRTSRISRAHLRCAAGGEGHEALHGLLAALDRGAPALAAALNALDRVGHRSGRDAGAGAVLALGVIGC